MSPRLVRALRGVSHVVVLLASIVWSCSAKVYAETDDAFFESKIHPLLTERCLECHSAETGKTQGGLALDTRLGWEKGGDSGAVIVPGNVDASSLIQAVLYGDGLQMPPEEGRDQRDTGKRRDKPDWSWECKSPTKKI